VFYFLIYWFSVYTFLVIISQRITLRPDRSGFDLYYSYMIPSLNATWYASSCPKVLTSS